MARVLVVDDEHLLRTMLRSALERAGYEVEEAPEGKTALERFRLSPADVVITDIVMPEKDGIETIIEMRREFPDVKIIAISGGGRLSPDGYLTAAEKLGAQRVFSKPVRIAPLLQAVSELIG